MKMLTLATVALLAAMPALAQDIPATPIPLNQTDPLTALGPAGESPQPAAAAAARKVAPAPAPRQVAQTEQAPAAPAPAAPRQLAQVEQATPAPAPPPRMGQAVQVEDEGAWDSCTFIQAFPGAAEVMCNYTKKIVRDTKVRGVGGKALPKTPAVPAAGPPFPRGALVEASPLSLPDRWQLCIVAANRLAQSNSYQLTCAGSQMNVAPQWVRAPADE